MAKSDGYSNATCPPGKFQGSHSLTVYQFVYWAPFGTTCTLMASTTGTLTGVGTALRRVRAACTLVPGVARVALRV